VSDLSHSSFKGFIKSKRIACPDQSSYHSGRFNKRWPFMLTGVRTNAKATSLLQHNWTEQHRLARIIVDPWAKAGIWYHSQMRYRSHQGTFQGFAAWEILWHCLCPETLDASCMNRPFQRPGPLLRTLPTARWDRVFSTLRWPGAEHVSW
jgi:hypothetical protein